MYAPMGPAFGLLKAIQQANEPSTVADPNQIVCLARKHRGFMIADRFGIHCRMFNILSGKRFNYDRQ
jgi:hypothetical protein